MTARPFATLAHFPSPQSKDCDGGNADRFSNNPAASMTTRLALCHFKNAGSNNAAVLKR